MNKNTLKKILDHPDKDEIIAKLVLDITPKDIHDWLSSKYSNVGDAKFIIPEKSIKIFKDTYLDVYSLIQEDIVKSKQSLANNSDEIELSVRSNPAYKARMMELAGKEIDIREMTRHLAVAIETRLGQILDEIQENPRDINTKVDRLVVEYAKVFGEILEKYYKFTEAPTEQFIQNNVTLQFKDQHILVLQEAIREVLAEMDLESSMLFWDRVTEKMANVKLMEQEAIPNTDIRLAEVKILNETINKKLNS